MEGLMKLQESLQRMQVHHRSWAPTQSEPGLSRVAGEVKRRGRLLCTLACGLGMGMGKKIGVHDKRLIGALSDLICFVSRRPAA